MLACRSRAWTVVTSAPSAKAGRRSNAAGRDTGSPQEGRCPCCGLSALRRFHCADLPEHSATKETGTGTAVVCDIWSSVAWRDTGGPSGE